MSVHQHYMEFAIRLGQQGIGRCAPNPSVGCVIVKNERIIGLGRTADGGRPHAETAALAMAGVEAKGATLYVTLEPCAHHGQTPPCAEAIIKAGIQRVVIGCGDPYPKVNGGGIALLRAADIEVVESKLQAEAQWLHRGFFSRIKRLRPWVTLKIATSADGFIATQQGESQWITTEPARRHGHLLRAQHDAILTGSGTYLKDNPQLTCRIDGLQPASPQRYILDRSGNISTAEGFTLLRQTDLLSALHELAQAGINHLMVEAGAILSAAFLREGLIDELYWYRSPKILGNGLPAFAGEWNTALADRPMPERIASHSLQSDQLDILRFTTMT